MPFFYCLINIKFKTLISNFKSRKKNNHLIFKNAQFYQSAFRAIVTFFKNSEWLAKSFKDDSTSIHIASSASEPPLSCNSPTNSLFSS
jgi:hypothetical protein